MSTTPNLIGTRLGDYEIHELIGSGGMASVYRGFDSNLQRQVAIKVLSAAAAADPSFIDRFRQEARLIASLRHPHIVQVYDLGQHDGYTYMVQELLPGPTLEQWMSDLAARGKRPKPEEIVAAISQLASALDTAHAAGIIHRDVKPANAIWNADGALVLTDFGVAKQLLSSTHQTQIGTVFGTPSYLSPEQAQMLPLTPASDIYSLGIVLYELIAGDVPFSGTTPMHVAVSHIQTPPPPLLPRRPDLPPEVEVVVQRALAKDPAARFGSASELAQALARAWVAPAPLLPPGGTVDIHNQVTRMWAPPAPAIPPASTTTPPAQAAISSRPATPPGGLQLSTPPPQRSRPMLPVLGVLLAVVLLGGVVLAARGGRSTVGNEHNSAATAPVVAQAPTAVALPTTLPTQPSTPSMDATTTSTDPFAQLQALLSAGRADGRAGTKGDELIATLAGAQQALATGDTNAAVKHFSTMQQTLLAGARAGTIDANFMAQAMRAIQSLANTYSLKLPLSVEFK